MKKDSACTSNYCGSNGLCKIDLDGNLKCVCYNGFSGKKCTFNTSDCVNSCLNNGECVTSLTNDAGFVCICR